MDEKLKESINVMCDTILTESEAMNLRMNMALKQLDIILEKNINRNIESIREVDKLINSIIMYEWIIQKKTEAIKILKDSL